MAAEIVRNRKPPGKPVRFVIATHPHLDHISGLRELLARAGHFPDIEGIDDFKGTKFHTAEWLDGIDLSDKRVGIIGSGSTGTQVISALANQGVNLKAFIRTPQWVFPLPNRRFGKIERAVVRAFPFIGRMAGNFYGWFFERVFAEAVIKEGWQRKFLSAMCKWHLGRVKDPVLRSKLTPTDEPLCKRMVMST